MIKYNDKNFVCHLDLGMDSLRGKWKSLILCHLNEEPIRFLELQRRIKGISQKMLTEQLRTLEKENLVNKKIYAEVPARVEYFLTEKGRELLPALEIIEGWAIKYFPNACSMDSVSPLQSDKK